MSMWRTSGIPSSEIVSWRWMRVITVASRFAAIVASMRRRAAASHCLCTTGCSELRMKKIQIASQGCMPVTEDHDRSGRTVPRRSRRPTRRL
jgi:hypothetical protein